MSAERAVASDRATLLHAHRPATVRITDACTACGACLATCPERALRRAPRKPLVVDDRCTACWDCVGICPAGAIVEVGR